MNFRVFDSGDELTAGAARAIVDAIPRDRRSVVALSGGNTPKPIYAALGSEPLCRELESREIIWVTGDERYVPQEDPASNSGMIRSTLFAYGVADRHSFLRFETESGDPPEVVRFFEEMWRSLKIERIDLAILGMGDDGHTASLFPGTTALDVQDRIATEVWVPKFDMWRLTLTLPVLQHAAKRFILAAGSNKKDLIRRVEEGEPFPIRRAIEGEGETWWFVDKDAYPR